jgi:antitoxin ParD1/3/4
LPGSADIDNFAIGGTVENRLEKFVSAKVEAGRYNSASEVVGEALRLLEEHDRNRASRLGEFIRELGRRLGWLDSGRQVKPSAARDRLKRKSEQRKSRS